MDKNELLYLLALQSVQGIGPVNAKKLMYRSGSAQALFEEGSDLFDSMKNVNRMLKKEFQDPLIFEKARAEIEFINANKVIAIAYNHDDYPDKLKHCQDGPLLLFKRGNFDLKDRKVISIVGSRGMSSYGIGFLKEFISEIKKFNPVIVSGLAYGIDITAHREALRNNLETIGILAHGLDRIYPGIHKREANKMIECGGLLTEFWSGSRPEKVNFVKRNRIVAGMSEATIVVESGTKGGSLITADFAQSYNRDVFAVPGRVDDPMSSGCNALIKSNKAALISSVKDLEYILNWKEERAVEKGIHQGLLNALSSNEQVVLNYLAKIKRQQLDLIALDCEISVSQAVSILLQLELKGLVRSIPGKEYQLIL